MMKFYKTRTAIAAWVLNTNSESIRNHLGHFTYRKHPHHIPMMCPRCGKQIPPGEEALVPEGVLAGRPRYLATCVGCADA